MKIKGNQIKYLFISVLLVSSCANTENIIIDQKDLEEFIYTELELEFGKARPEYAIINVTIQGEEFKLMFDSGSDWGTITLIPEAIERINVSFTGNNKKYKDAEGNIYYAREFIIPNIKLGNLEISNLIASENLTSPEGFDGYIGLGLLKNFNILVDYSEHKMVLYKKGVIPDFVIAEGWFYYNYSDNMQFFVTFNFLSDEYQVGLDSGCNCFAVPKNSELANEIIKNLGVKEENIEINERTGKEVYIYSVDHLYLNDYDLGQHEIVIVDMANYMGNGIMGYDFFNNNKVFINLENREIWLQRVEKDY